MSDNVLDEVDEHGAALLTLSRSERRNMWTAQRRPSSTTLDRAAADTSVRVIVVTGAGSSFVPGLDPTAPRPHRGVGLHGQSPPGVRCHHHSEAGDRRDQRVRCDASGLGRGADVRSPVRVRGVKFEHRRRESVELGRRGRDARGSSRDWQVLGRTRFELLGRPGAGRSSPRRLRNWVSVETSLPSWSRAVEDALAFAHGLTASVSPVAMAMIKSELGGIARRRGGRPDPSAGTGLKLAKGSRTRRRARRAWTEKRRPDFAPYLAVALSDESLHRQGNDRGSRTKCAPGRRAPRCT